MDRLVKMNRSSCRYQNAVPGFTLIEVLVVLVIVGIGITMLSLSVGVGREAKQHEAEARRLFAILAYARDFAMLEAREIGFYFEADRYQVFELSAKGWQPLTDEKALRKRTLQNGFELELHLEDTPIALKKKSDKADAISPQVLFLSSTEVTPFQITLRSYQSSTTYSIAVQETGEMELQKNGETFE